MKQNTHPVSTATTYQCGNCNTEIETSSTKQPEAKLDVCSNCHPAYTGEAKRDASGSKVDAFNARYGIPQ